MKKIKLSTFKTLKIFLLIAFVINLLPLFIFADTDQVTYYGNEVKNNVITYTTAEDGKVKISKRIIDQGPENYFDIELEVQTYKKVDTIEIDKDISLVLVLDTSSSMTWCMDTNSACANSDEQRIYFAKEAIKNFTDVFFPKDENGNKLYNDNRQLALVTYNTSTNTLVNFGDYASTDEEAFDTIVNSITTSRGTNLQKGLATGASLFTDDIQNKYMIVLTDGYPTLSGNKGSSQIASNDYGNNDAIAAAATAATLRPDIKTYVIGVGLDGQRSYDNLTNKYEVGYTETKYTYINNSLSNVIGKEIIMYLNKPKDQPENALCVNTEDGLYTDRLSLWGPEDNEEWIITNAPNNTNRYVIKNVKTGKYISRSGTTVTFTTNIDNAQRFIASSTTITNGTKFYYNNNGTNYYLRLYDGNWVFRSGDSNNSFYLAEYKESNTTRYITTPEHFKRWLNGEVIKGGDLNSTPEVGGIGYTGNDTNAYYDVLKSDELAKAYASIFEKIEEEVKILSSAWIATDPMNGKNISLGNGIIFQGFYDEDDEITSNLYSKTDTNNTKNSSNKATFSISNDSISWDLRESIPEESGPDNNKTYTYKLKYRVRLQNENSSFVENEEYFTNGEASLDYAIIENDKQLKSGNIKFENPKVIGFLSEFSFDKISIFTDSALAGATFELKHDVEHCVCKDEVEHMDSNYALTSISNSDSHGNVVFNNIPSGHTYILSEKEAPENYEKTDIKYRVTVAYDNITITDMDGNEIQNLVIDNYPKGTDLEITKTVKADNTKGTFEFVLNATYNNKPVVGTYSYTLGDTTGSVVFKNGKATINNENIKLSHGETIVIHKLPYGINYSVTEVSKNGYVAEYCINFNGSCMNSNDIQVGLSTSTETIRKDNINRVEFVNVKQYEMPETGSKGMLIVQIIGGMFLLLPIVEIYSTLIKKREGANSEY